MLGSEFKYAEKNNLNEVNLLELKDVTKIFKSGHVRNYALDRVSISIVGGESLSIVGESGSGKSTLGLVAIGLLKPNRGKILFEGSDVSKLRGKNMKDFRQRSQMVFQDPYSSLNPYRTIFEIVSAPILYNMKYFEESIGEDLTKNISRKKKMEKMRAAVAQMLNVVGLSPGEGFLDQYPKKLSGGQRQRVAIARSLILKPKFIVLDEATSMLDVSISAQILNLLSKLKKEFKFSILYISHELATAKYVSDKMAVMNLGRIVEYGKTDEITSHPMHPYTDILIKSMLEVGALKNELPISSLDFNAYNGGMKGCTFVHSCPFKTEICMEQDPILEDRGQGHMVACFHPLI